MKLSYAAIVAIFSGYGQAQFTWPSAYDELEDVMFLNTGYKSRGFGTFVTPCSFSPFPGRQTAAEWLRAGFHDMATTNVYYATTDTVHGGIDASLAFELNDGDNTGLGFNSTFLTYAGFFNSRLPAADLVALGVYASVRSCGGPVIPMRGGRVDATQAGPIGVPQPQNGAGVFSTQFLRMGFNNSAMIQMTACGHTLGGVHANDFSNIVTPGTVPNDFQLFDTTETWDELIASRYVNGPDTDPLAVGISVSSGRNSDFAVFNIDKNVTIQTMTTRQAFDQQCQAILQEMIEVVDPTLVNLSSVIVPYEVKPSGLQLTLLSGGTQLEFSGDIRVRTTTRSAASITGVTLTYTDRNGNANSGTITATDAGSASGFDDSFEFYSFNATLPTASSISSFTVAVASNGLTTTYSNGGSGFPISDSVIVQTPQSCMASGQLTVVAAVRSTLTTAVNMTVTEKQARNVGSPTPSPLPSLASTSSFMTKGAAVGPYTLYSVSLSGVTVTGTKYGVSSGSFSDTFKDVSDLGTICASSPPAGSSSSSLSSSSTKTSSTTSSTTSKSSSTTSKIITSSTTKTSSSSSSPSTSSTKTSSSTTKSSSSTSKTTTSSTTKPSSSSTSSPTVKTSTSTSKSLTSSSSTSSISKSSSSSSISSTKTSSSTSSTIISTTSSTSASASATLAVKQTVGAYTFQGCWTEATNIRALSGASYYDYNAMTLEECASDCAGWAYFGVEYGGECYCGTSPNTGSVNTTLSDCSFICPGNPAEYCGAGNRLELYMLSTLSSSSSSVLSSSTLETSTSTSTSIASTSASTSSTPTPTIKSQVGAYSYYACMTEATNSRALSSASFYNYTSMTLEMCASNCAGYKYWGTEYGGECYCGNVFQAGSVNATDSDCNFSCPGNGGEFCGAGDRLSAYYLSS